MTRPVNEGGNPRVEELVSNAYQMEHQAQFQTLTLFGSALLDGRAVYRSEMLKALCAYRTALELYHTARSISPSHIGAMELQSHALFDAAALEVVAGLDPRERIELGLETAQEWAKTEPEANATLEQYLRRAQHLVDEMGCFIPDPIAPEQAARIMRVP